jgi:hypothetical protein
MPYRIITAEPNQESLIRCSYIRFVKSWLFALNLCNFIRDFEWAGDGTGTGTKTKNAKNDNIDQFFITF